jgi:hypothetical protein
VTPSGHDCNQDEGLVKFWEHVGETALILEVLFGLAAIVLVAALVMWSWQKYRRAVEAGPGSDAIENTHQVHR